ncbi:FAD-dependent oxidoreductase [Thalassobacillus sp. CUG 92003]|uniref:FAD-dependent oxidoreductase n=1 Tax=Thalassobacillus sp. CUG 92003 TaxID=2736641 RepID=UPI0015E64E79|nr:FAD-dependent oxidoreductase [Thalassobacillus sp. CUG 92003]
MTEERWMNPEPLWRENESFPRFKPLQENIETDIAIVGGGITGITTAYLLSLEGKKVALIEADHILNGTTGHTTAKVTAQHGFIYHELIQHFGKETARLYYQANQQAIDFMAGLVEKHHIDCNWERDDAFIYATTQQGQRKLELEHRAYAQLGIPGDYINTIPFDSDALGGLFMPHQAHFHPLKYLQFMVEEIIKRGGEIFEHTVATGVTNDQSQKVMTREGFTITCDHAVSCSHFPFYDGNGFYFSRMYAERSYVIAIEPENHDTTGMYLSIDEPKRSVRPVQYQGKSLLLIGGESHRTGEGIDTAFHYNALEEFAAQTFGVKEKLFQWSAQDLTTLDKVPYIGKITRNKPDIYVATGFRKWGMTTSTVAARLITDSIMGKDNPYVSLYTPSRFKANPSIKQFISQNFNVGAHLLEGKMELVGTRPKALKKGQGDIVQIRGERAGAFRDEDGNLHVLDTTCTHMGCEVDWNSAERTWDCPCHGSRFSYDGEVMEGPAKQPLTKLDHDE